MALRYRGSICALCACFLHAAAGRGGAGAWLAYLLHCCCCCSAWHCGCGGCLSIRMVSSISRLHRVAGHLRDGAAFSDGSSSPPAPSAASASTLALAPRQLEPSDLMFGGAPISGVPEAEATATVHACLRAGIRHYDTAPLYGDSEDKLGAALRSATVDSCGADVTFAGSTGMEVGGDPIYIYTKTGRLIRERIDAESGLGWRPAGPGADGAQQWPAVGGRRIVTDDFSANGAFLSHGESRQRLGGDLRIDTLRIHDADTVGGLGATQATGALDQALLPEGMLAGMTALKQDGASHSHDQTAPTLFCVAVL
jgi:hypothetical protein